MHWTLIIMISVLINFALVFLTYKFITEVEIQNEQASVCEGVLANWEILKQHYKRQKSNVLLCIDYCFQDNLLFVFLFWVPYYFMKEGFAEKAALIGICFPAGSLIGSLALTPIVALCERYAAFITSFLFLKVPIFASFFFIQPTVDNFAIYAILFLVTFTLQIVAQSRLSTTEVTEKSANYEEKYLAMNFSRFIREAFTGLCVLLFGVFL